MAGAMGVQQAGLGVHSELTSSAPSSSSPCLAFLPPRGHTWDHHIVLQLPDSMQSLIE